VEAHRIDVEGTGGNVEAGRSDDKATGRDDEDTGKIPPITLANSSSKARLEVGIACMIELSIDAASVGTDTNGLIEVTGPGIIIPRLDSRSFTASVVLLVFVELSRMDDVVIGVRV
jgi:hypothetical protein